MAPAGKQVAQAGRESIFALSPVGNLMHAWVERSSLRDRSGASSGLDVKTDPPSGTTSLRVVLGDQLTRGIASLADLDRARDTVLMVEVRAECTYVRHHQKKIVLILSAMRHFADGLRAEGIRVRYVRLDDPANTQSFRGEVVRAVEDLAPTRIVATEPGEWRVLDDMRGWQDATGVPLEVRPDTRFIASIADFRHWASGRASLRMEFFYRDMRARTAILMDDGKPAGGRWNYDSENRKRLPKGIALPPTPVFPPDEITRDVMALVARAFGDHFGAVDGFSLPVTAAEAEHALAAFVAERLPGFGDWQDAMKWGSTALFHALVSTSLNLGLLDPRAVCGAAEAAFRAGLVPLAAAEGFIRQIIGWREYVRGVYWLHMPGYGTRNALGAHRKLPWFYWSGETGMRCLADAIASTREHAYAHHIQRLMLTGNFALLAGIDPDEVDEWYLVVYADAYQWVEMPNTRGMALHADGGVMGSKPYAASGAYINRMSDYCAGCRYDVGRATGEGACPFNFLYWDFIDRHADRWAENRRMAMPLAGRRRMGEARMAELRAEAARFLDRMDRGEPV